MLNLEDKNTKILVQNNSVIVRLYDTNIIVANPNRIILNTDRHRTKTMKSRMNKASTSLALDFRIYQKNFEWYLEYFDKTYKIINQIIVINRDNKMVIGASLVNS